MMMLLLQQEFSIDTNIQRLGGISKKKIIEIITFYNLKCEHFLIIFSFKTKFIHAKTWKLLHTFAQIFAICTI